MASKHDAKPTRKVRHIGKGGTIAIPADLRARLGFEEGAAVVLQERDGGLLLLTTAQAERDDEAKSRREEERERFWDEMDAAYARLRSDPDAWREEQEERALWDNTLMDGLDPDEVWEESDFVQQ